MHPSPEQAATRVIANLTVRLHARAHSYVAQVHDGDRRIASAEAATPAAAWAAVGVAAFEAVVRSYPKGGA